jgi:sulfur relay (sulfurtransferase) DsrC/TusE family protein
MMQSATEVFTKPCRKGIAVPTKTKDPLKYDVHPSIRMVQHVVANMKEKTGRSLDEWLAIAKKGPTGQKERAAWLKDTHGLGTNYATWIATQSIGKESAETDADQYLQHADDYVAAMFAGAKEHLKPIYEEILKYAMTLGSDIRVSPCKTMVPIYRKNVIAQIKPTTRTRIDLGLALANSKVPKRLINTGGYEKKDRISHRIEITQLADFDADAKKWMKVAYDANV